uniref:Acyl-CoA thioester hydrolase/bile acid-CoA amino acid N-acetyltransferase domain-containing protein n=1 Tax=Ciona savignyi TaxID=51511 RepID=H2Z826_CIOSA
MMNGAVTSARFNVSAVNSMSDEPLLISISNLPVKRKLTIHSSVTADNGALFECIAIYKSSEKGFIDLSEDPAIGGMYKGIEPMGLFWAMDPSKLNKKKYNRLTKTNVETPQVHNFVVYDNIVDNLDEFYQLKSKGQLQNLASTQVNRWFMAKGTKRSLLTVEKHGIHGTLFIPPGGGPFPGILVMFGGYPGTMEYKASLFSSHGYAALALAYYGAAGLPEIDFERFSQGGSLKMEYFETAVQLL